MKFSELREGNIVDQNGVIAPVNAYQIYQFSLFQMGLMDKGDQYDFYAGWKPVELTEQMLKKLFKIDMFFLLDDFQTYMLFPYEGGWALSFQWERLGSPVIYSLHHLQNLVFDLTGKELDTTKISDDQ